jgi:hypothetical protein
MAFLIEEVASWTSAAVTPARDAAAARTDGFFAISRENVMI